MIKFKLVFFLLFVLLVNVLVAQKPNRGIAGLKIGTSFYQGDLNSYPFEDLGYAVSGFYKHPIDTRFILVGKLDYLKINGKGTLFEGAVDRSFSNSMFEASSLLEFNFRPFVGGHKKYDFTPYVFAGASLAYVTAEQINFVLSVPFGFGYKYNVNEHLILGGNLTLHKTFTDRLDFNPREVRASQKQENYFGNVDWYSVMGIYLAYKINYRMKCPAFD